MALRMSRPTFEHSLAHSQLPAQGGRAGDDGDGEHDRAGGDDVVDAALRGADVDHLGENRRDEQRAGYIQQ